MRWEVHWKANSQIISNGNMLGDLHEELSYKYVRNVKYRIGLDDVMDTG